MVLPRGEACKMAQSALGKRSAIIFLVFLVFLVSLLACASLAVAGCGRKAARPPGTLETPQLDSGPISGSCRNGIWQYLGIPYAAPPVGELRWRDPQPVEPWDEVLPCTDYGPSCPQIIEDWTGQTERGE